MTGRHEHESGQVLMVGLLLALILMLSIPVMVYLNQTYTSHQAFSERKLKGMATANEAITFIKAVITANATNWALALNHTFTGPLALCSGSGYLRAVDSSPFKISCDATGAQVYQIHLRGTSWSLLSGRERAVVSLEAYVSPQTVAVNLPNDVHQSVALQLGKAPATLATTGASTYDGAIDVHWGPLSVLDPAVALDIQQSPMDAGHYPRKYLNNGMLYASARPVTISQASPTDSTEVWAYQKIGLGPPLDDAGANGYLNAAANLIPVTPCYVGGSCTPVVGGAGTGHLIVPPGQVLLLDHAFAVALGGLPSSTVVYIEGDAELDHFSWDAKPPAIPPPASGFGALIVTGNLYLNTPDPSLPGLLRIPPTAKEEYVNTALMPCVGSWTASGATCSAPTPYQFRGFLWVKNNLIVQQAGWGLAGTVVVGDPSNPGLKGEVDVASAGSPAPLLTVYYDDEVNHAIKVSQNRLQNDFLKQVPAH